MSTATEKSSEDAVNIFEVCSFRSTMLGNRVAKRQSQRQLNCKKHLKN